MATVRAGSRSVLLVVDVQAGVIAHSFRGPETVRRVAQAVEKARQAGTPVIWVQHRDEELVPDSAPWQLAEGLEPLPDEIRIHKEHNSSFENTPLEGELTRLGASRILLAGAATNWCIRATAYGALERGYDLCLLSDAHTTGSQALEDGFVLEAESVIRDLNLAMTWLSYPGRRTTTATVDEADFGPGI
jgi:nicotinamidase-related amidase